MACAHRADDRHAERIAATGATVAKAAHGG